MVDWTEDPGILNGGQGGMGCGERLPLPTEGRGTKFCEVKRCIPVHLHLRDERPQRAAVQAVSVGQTLIFAVVHGLWLITSSLFLDPPKS